MIRFAALLSELDRTTRTTGKVDAMASYFTEAMTSRDVAADAAWAVFFLTGGRTGRTLPVRRLAGWAMERAGVEPWLFDACYETVGDLAETIALLLPEPGRTSDMPLHRWVEERLLPLAGADECVQQRIMLDAWNELDPWQRFVWNKLITGGFRIGVSRALVVRALARASGVDEPTLAHRLSGGWEPGADAFQALVSPDSSGAESWRPYPFYLAYALDLELEQLGDVSGWQVEWKWDGIRAQLVRRDVAQLWSRGEELVTESFPEIAEAAALLPPGTVLDGEVLPWRDDAPLPFAQLQRRLGRRRVGANLLREVPVVLVVYDVLEHEGRDVRTLPLHERRRLLEDIIPATSVAGRLLRSPTIPCVSWADARDAYTAARTRAAEGLMLKRLDSEYGAGRRRGAWWKWKTQPYTVDAVMMYAQAGHGRRAALHTDYTFGVWEDIDGDRQLVPFAKAYTGLSDAEIRKLDHWIRRNTVEKFGPVRQVTPHHVFEIAFEGIQRSPRHRSGIAVRFPRILRWRTDRNADDADSIDALRTLLESQG